MKMSSTSDSTNWKISTRVRTELTEDVDLRKKNEGIYVRRDDQERKKKEFDNVYYRNHDLEEILDIKHLEGQAQQIVSEQMSYKQKVLSKVKNFEKTEIYGKLDFEIREVDEEKATKLKKSIWKKVFDFSEDRIYYLNSLTNQKLEQKPMGLMEEDEDMEKVVIGPENAARVIKDEWEEVPIDDGKYQHRPQKGDEGVDLREVERKILKPISSKLSNLRWGVEGQLRANAGQSQTTGVVGKNGAKRDETDETSRGESWGSANEESSECED